MRTNKRRIKQLRKRHRNTQKYNRRKYGGADGEEEAEEKRWNNVIKNLNVANKKRTNTIISQSIQNRGANLVKILQSVCKNPDNCLDLGSYSDTIKRFFNDFIIDKSAISYASTPLKKLGDVSANGFVLEIPFKRDGYTAYSVLKSSTSPESDNLLYEYYVGKNFINKYIKRLPCFVETYGLYEYDDISLYIKMLIEMKNNKVDTLDIKNHIKPLSIDGLSLDEIVKMSCEKNKRICVLIQHFDKFRTFQDTFNNHHDSVKYDIYNILYQVYFGLAYLGNNYTHYDLHTDNVCLYKPFDGNRYILMRYHNTSNGKVIEFKSEYISKIIDYGRNYFNDGTMSTKDFVESVCKNTACSPKCGTDVGFKIITGSIGKPTFNFYWIDPVKPNTSHDLRLARILEHTIVGYVAQTFRYIDDYGTPENNSGDKDDITDIFNMVEALEEYIPVFNSAKQNKKYDSTWKAAATLDVYNDGRDYEFNILPDTP
jgi:hypothetical protein